MSSRVEVMPGKSLGMFTLGMPRPAAQSVPGATELMKTPLVSRASIEFREQAGEPFMFIHLHFSDDDEVAEIEAGGDADVVLSGYRFWGGR